VLAWCGEPKFYRPRYFLKPDVYPPDAEKVPAGLDWNLWLGPAAVRPYNHIYLPRTWRGWYDFGDGALGDWACHTLDAPYWALELGMPACVESVLKKETFDDFVPEQSILKFHFPARGSQPPVDLTWYEGGLVPEIRKEWGIDKLKGFGMIMIGDKKSLLTGGAPSNPRLLIPDDEWHAFAKSVPEKTIPRVPEGKPQVEWVQAIKNETLPGSNFNYAAGLTEMTLLGVMSQHYNKTIEYDSENMKIINHPDLNSAIKLPAREGWRYGDELWKNS
jgi:hypothetical protein